MVCDARIRPFPNDTEVACELPDGHDGNHSGVLRDYAYEGSATLMTWAEQDRRCFHGDWPGQCPERAGISRCILPTGHPGRHAF